MDVVTGAIGSLISKLGELLKDEYNLQTGVKEQVESLSRELESAQAALSKVGDVPPEQRDKQVRIWAREIREASYDMEDVLDTFLVERLEKGHEHTENESLLQRLKGGLLNMMGSLSKRRKIAGTIKDIKQHLHDVTERHRRYTIDNIVAQPAARSTIDPRLAAMYKEVTHLIGIDKSRGELISKLCSKEGSGSNEKMKIVAVVGVGGLGKTTLAKAVYDELKPKFRCGAFVPVGRNPDLKKILRDILIDLDKEKYTDHKFTMLDEKQLIEELREFLGTTRYFIVIDDVWDITSWKTIKLALDPKNSGSRVIITTRNREVANIEEVYELRPLSRDNSEKLFYTRLFGVKGECPANHPAEASEKILNKCGGVPLAVITMASLLVGKSREDWFDVCNSPGFYRDKGNQQVADDTEWILSLSYYDLPSYLRTCLLYLSVYPEDYVIGKDSLIRKWIAEGFVEKQTGRSLFERGEEYFNQLINRSMIQAVEEEGAWLINRSMIQAFEVKGTGIIYGCRVHDMVLDLIRGLSDEENFVTISNDNAGTSSSRNKVRRLAHHNRIMKQTQQDDHMGMAHVRSMITCMCDIGGWVLHPRSFKLLRVLALEKCDYNMTSWQGVKQHLGNLLHLRYLGLRNSDGIKELPEEIGKLKFLQTLDLRCSGIEVLPSGICQLTQLVCLYGGFWTCMPDGLFLTKLTSLEDLRVHIDKLDEAYQRQFVKDLGNLSEARLLNITVSLTKMVQSDLVQSLGNLHKLQYITLRDSPNAATREWDTLMLSRHLRLLELQAVQFHRLPSWISPAHLPSLYYLSLSVDYMDEAGLRALGGFAELCVLKLETGEPSMSCMATVPNIAAGDAFFQKLRCCHLSGWMVQLVPSEDSTRVSFTIWNGKQGAMAFVGSKTEDVYSTSVAPPRVMPDLQELLFEVPVRPLYNLGLECLPSLRRVEVSVDCEGASADDVEKAEAELRDATELHPNRPTIDIFRSNDGEMVEEDEGELASSAGDDQVADMDSRGGPVTPSC